MNSWPYTRESALAEKRRRIAAQINFGHVATTEEVMSDGDAGGDGVKAESGDDRSDLT